MSNEAAVTGREGAERDEVQEFLPLKSTWLHILMSILEGPRHGYGVMVDVTERTQGHVRLWPATLYNTLKELLDEGLIADAEDHLGEDEDSRRRYYRITDLGRSVLDAEAARLEELARSVRARQELAGSGRSRAD